MRPPANIGVAVGGLALHVISPIGWFCLGVVALALVAVFIWCATDPTRAQSAAVILCALPGRKHPNDDRSGDER